MLHKRRSQNINFVPKAGEQPSLCSNKVDTCSPALGFKSNSPLATEDILLDYLASLLVRSFIAQEKKNESTSSNLLSGINKRTG
jgi:hypothetical protein